MTATPVVDTASVAPHERFDYWCEAARRLFLPLSLERPIDEGSFAARSWQQDLCGIQIGRTVADASVITRTSGGIAELDPESLILVVMLRGQALVSQQGRESACHAGDITTTDSSLPFSSRTSGVTDVITFALPKAMLRRDAERLSAQTALRIGRDSARSRVVRPFLCRLARAVEREDVGCNEPELAESVLGVVRGLYNSPATGRISLPRPELLLRVKSYIDDNLGDPLLDADGVARAHFVSRRYLYRLFENEGVGVREWIRSRRLERCRRDLADPAHAHEAIFGIAARWGFTNPAHFSRSFRDAFGVAPRDFRRAVS